MELCFRNSILAAVGEDELVGGGVAQGGGEVPYRAPRQARGGGGAHSLGAMGAGWRR